MQKKMSNSLSLASIAFLFGFLLFPGMETWAGDTTDNIATMVYEANGVSWVPKADYENVTLTVSKPDGTVERGVIQSGLNPYFKGTDLADGLYTYEMTVSPVLAAGVSQQLKDARASGDDTVVSNLQASGALPSGPVIQTGNFRILGGSLVDPNLIEGAQTDAN